MAAAQHISASAKQGICKKLVTILKKRYQGRPPKDTRPVLETVIYAICLENNSPDEADADYARLGTAFHDLNEVRVSSISELIESFGNASQPELRALRIRSVLRYVFEKHFAFDFEQIRRKTLDLASKHLMRIKQLSPFIRTYTLQSTMGSHLVPIDDHMCHAAIWLGLAEVGLTPQKASESLKSAVRKPDCALFCHLLRQLANDPKLMQDFDLDCRKKSKGETFDVMTAPQRLTELFSLAEKRAKQTKTRKKSAKKKTASKTTTKKTVRKPKKAATGSKTAKKKKAAKKTPATKKTKTKKKKK